MKAPDNAPTRSDLADRRDIVRLVDRFYAHLRTDEVLGPIFNDVAQVDWETHLPKMYDFWETVLFRAGKYRGNPIAAHAKLIPLADMSRGTFDRWLRIFKSTVAELFEGENADTIGRAAEDMANVIFRALNGPASPSC